MNKYPCFLLLQKKKKLAIDGEKNPAPLPFRPRPHPENQMVGPLLKAHNEKVKVKNTRRMKINFVEQK